MSSTDLIDLTAEQVHGRLAELAVIDVRTPGEYAAGHVPGAHNVPLDRLGEAVDVLHRAGLRRDLVLVCGSGERSAQAQRRLAEQGVEAANLAGGTDAWVLLGHDVHRAPEARAVWPMERQVRFAAGSLVLAGVVAGRRWPAARALSAGVAGGLVFSGVTGTCGMARVLAKLPFNRGAADSLPATLAALSR